MSDALTSKPPLRVLALAGGVGGAKLAAGLSHLLKDRLTVLVNTGDDFEHVGLHAPFVRIAIHLGHGERDNDHHRRAGDALIRAPYILADDAFGIAILAAVGGKSAAHGKRKLLLRRRAGDDHVAPGLTVVRGRRIGDTFENTPDAGDRRLRRLIAANTLPTLQQRVGILRIQRCVDA